MTTIDYAFGYFPKQLKKRYTKSRLVLLLRDLRVLDIHGRIRGWEHLQKHFHSIIDDLLLLVNTEKRYPPRGPTEELRIPEDVSTEIHNRIYKYL